MIKNSNQYKYNLKYHRKILKNFRVNIKILIFKNNIPFKIYYKVYENILIQIKYMIQSHVHTKYKPISDNYDDKDFSFNKIVTIKDDKVVEVVDKNLLIYNEMDLYSHENIIFINIDDEVNIKSMHTLIFSRMNIELNCCSTCDELQQLLMSVYSKYTLKADAGSAAPQVVVLLDHVLDGASGLDVYAAAAELQRRFQLHVFWVLLSSSEDEVTTDKYRDLGVTYFIQKPLSILKLNSLLEYLRQYV
eukprot:Mrub_08864.p1 GENE.Mrub_08864~~Mrub_08864.p1  ORF type:complete len:255 (-),score=71.79 Mrub_08864:31-771(-)